MAMRLAGTTMLPTIKEREQLLPLLALCQAIVVGTDACVGCGEVVCLEEVELGFKCACDEDGVFGDDGEFVEDEGVRGADGGDCELRWGVLKGVEGLLFLGTRGGRRRCWRFCWFVGQRW